MIVSLCNTIPINTVSDSMRMEDMEHIETLLQLVTNLSKPASKVTIRRRSNPGTPPLLP